MRDDTVVPECPVKSAVRVKPPQLHRGPCPRESHHLDLAVRQHGLVGKDFAVAGVVETQHTIAAETVVERTGGGVLAADVKDSEASAIAASATRVVMNTVRG